MPSILIAADERALAEVLRAGLIEDGFSVAVAADGIDALAEVARDAPTLVILDLNMPLMSGEQVLREIRRRGLRSKVLLMSSRRDIAKVPLELDADGYVAKPFDFEELRRVIYRAIGSSLGQAEPPGNLLLASLPETELAVLRPDLESVHMNVGAVAAVQGRQPDHLYFPTGAISCVGTVLPDGGTNANGLLGRSSCLGLPPAMVAGGSPWSMEIAVEGGAERMEYRAVGRHLEDCQQLTRLLYQAASAAVRLVAMNAACARFHATHARLARWLLTAFDEAQTSEVALSLTAVAALLGLDRADAMIASGAFQQAGFIQYRRGAFVLGDRESLLLAACPCYVTARGVLGAALAVPR